MPTTTRSNERNKKQKTEDVNTLKCHLCGKYWNVGRSFTQHYNYCLSKHNQEKQINRRSRINDISTNVMLQGFVKKDTSQRQLDAKVLPIKPIINFCSDNTVNKINDQCHEIATTSFQQTDIYQPKQNDFVYSKQQLHLMEYMKEFIDDTRKSQHLWPRTSLCQIQLLKLLNDMDCPKKAYDGVIKWVNKWSSEPNTNTSVFENGKEMFVRRDTVIKKLTKQFHLKGLYPREEKIYLTSLSNNEKEKQSLNVSVFDFKYQLLSLLRDKELMSPSNLVLDGSQPGTPPEFNQEYISEINHCEWYKNAYEYYECKFGRDKNRVICGIILTVDKTNTDAKGKLCLEPVKFSLSIFNTETRRKNESAWKRLGYINDLDTYRLSNYFEDSNECFSNRSRSNIKATKKSITYHLILEKIFASLKVVQNDGFVWKLQYPDNKFYKIRFVFPICMCIVDMKGGKQLCGMYDSYGPSIKRPCISCFSSGQDMSNFRKQCNPALDTILRQAISSKNVDTLKNVSQYENPRNAFFNLELGGWKYGIWGMCPSEVLHQFYEGIIDYALDEFYLEVIKKSTMKENLILGCEDIWKACKNQSDQDFPKGNFIMGITNKGKIKGVEKFASLFYLSLFLHTKLAQTDKFSGERPLSDELLSTFKEWRELFEDMLYYHDWLMQKHFKRNSLKAKQKKINDLNKRLQKLIKRKELGVQYIPKFHEFFHITRDIKRFGPARGYDSCANEGFLGTDKSLSQHTQKRSQSFSKQTSIRHYENDVVEFAFKSIHEAEKPHNGVTGKNIKLRGTIIAKFETKSSSVEFFNHDERIPLKNHDDYGHELKTFMNTSIFSLMKTSKDVIFLTCYNAIIKE